MIMEIQSDGGVTMYMRELSHQVLCNFEEPVVTVAQGYLRGITVEGTYLFRGVPYAKSERFATPSVPEGWKTIRAAENFGPACRSLYIPPMPDDYRVPRYFYPESEVCQFLNIWTSTLESDAKRPVLVWLSGNGWISGSSMELMAADGENLAAAENIVVVGVNHRNQALGYLELSALNEKFSDSGIAGLLDLIAALRWIRDNIAAFGGDPDNVTLAGHGGGAEKVVALMQSPAADGLYHKVILESGGLCGVVETPEQAKKEAQVFSALVVQQLERETVENADWYDLADAVLEALWLYEKTYGHPYRFRPIPDGKNYLGHPLSVGFRAESRNIPMMIGSCAGEKTDDKTFCEARIAQADAPVWKWLFALEAPFMGGSAPWYGAEIPYVFRNAAYMEAQYDPGISEVMEDAVSSAWVAFARNGDPNHHGIPHWKDVEKDQFFTMVFDRECRVAADAETLRTNVWEDTHNSGTLPGVKPKEG